MNLAETDALVSIIKSAIHKEVSDFRNDFVSKQKEDLTRMIDESVKSQFTALALDVDARIKSAVLEIPKPADGLSATPEMVFEQVKAYMADHPVIAPEPLAPTPEALLDAVKSYVDANPIAAPKDGQDATPEMIAEKVAEWIKSNPLPEPKEPTEDQLDLAVEKHFKDFEVEVPDVPFETIAKAVSEHMKANPVQPPEPMAPTPEQLKTAVEDHLKAHPVPPGERGLDGLEINILSSLDKARRYPKGTYAPHEGGIIRASRDTDPGDPLKSGWDVVVRGVAAIEVHQLEVGEFAIKSILTGGVTHITKAHFPTLEYKGVWKESFGEYKKGHTVTQSGSLWVCLADTTSKPGGSDSWQLAAKKGTDGKDLNTVKLNRPDTYKLGGA